MRLPFADEKRLKRAAKKAVDSGTARVRRWWVNKYHLPTSHPLFQNQAMAELTQEMYEDMYLRQEELRDALESSGRGDGGSAILEQLNALNAVLGDPPEGADPLVDQWEADLAAGRTPDLNAKVAR